MTEIRTRYFSNPRAKTIVDIERVVEWVEEQRRPFTTHEAFMGSRSTSGNTAYRTIRDLEHYGLIVRVNARDAKPARWLPIDRRETLGA